jgi:uncharacterized protein YjdB
MSKKLRVVFYGGSAPFRFMAAAAAICVSSIALTACDEQVLDAGSGEVTSIGLATQRSLTASGPAFSKSGSGPVEVIDPSASSLPVGTTLQLLALDKDGSALEAKWSSSDVTIGAVTEAGLLSGVSEGEVVVTAQTRGKPASASFLVTTSARLISAPGTPGTPRLTTAAVSADTFAVAGSWGPVATATSYEWRTGANQTTWSTSGTVSDTTASLRAPVLSGAGSYWFCIIAVNSAGRSEPACNSYAPPTQAPTAVATVSVSPSPLSLSAGATQQLTATLRDASGNVLTGRSVAWSSSNIAVATVSTSGVVTGVTGGSATITATSEGQSGTSSVTVTVSTTTPPPTGGGVVFSSDWSSSSLGSSNAAITEGGRWNQRYCDMFPDLMHVVASETPPGTPLTRSLRLQQRATQCRAVEVKNAIPRSTSYFVRYYFRNDDTSSAPDHIVTTNTMGYTQLTFLGKQSSSSGYQYFLILQGGGRTYPVNWWYIYDRATRQRVRLPLGQWYRFEFHVEYVDPVGQPDRFRIWPRVYDAAGTLLYDHNDFFMNDAWSATYEGRNDWSLASWYASGRTMIFDDLERARHFGLGNNGPGGATDTGLYWYFAGVEIRTDRWPGPAR